MAHNTASHTNDGAATESMLEALKQQAGISSPVAPSTAASTDLHQQCLDLLSEIDEFQGLLKRTLRNPQLVEVRQFRSNVTSELRMLQKLEQRMPSCTPVVEESDAGSGQREGESEAEKRLAHALRSSNLPFYQAVWNIAKVSCTGLVAIGKRFYWDGETKASEREKAEEAKRNKKSGKSNGGGEKQPNKDKSKSVLVDIVAGDGEQWVKVSTISENRLLFEMAEKGWERDSEDECLSDDGSDSSKRRTILRNFDGDEDDEDDDDELELIKLAKDLRKAANATRVRYRHPRIRVVLPRIEEGNVPEIDDVLQEIRSYGVEVQAQKTQAADASLTGLAHLLPQPFEKFTSTLNVDCTLLLALVSDLSHTKNMTPLPGFHKAIIRQIEVEKEQPLLPTELWPATSNRDLVCTQEAATRMREIVQVIGSGAEKERTRIMLGDSPYDSLDSASLVQKFQTTSEYQVPAGWKLPIRVVESQKVIDNAKAQGKLPSVAEEVAESLSDINYGVFMYGWATGMMTISSNRTIDKQIETMIEKSRNGDEHLEGPNVWICDTARSLAGKDRDRKI
ncbi:hypothetical protein N7462_004593 [Penicillium macrosclerotiorum]|uniref:uncharacterized protein n=1 Tax=Penicillium macrosclerotiorum TaxID=303699 RepID=UPI002548EEDB|nr:uncharacterized protein N7462_004593 [Penicillium macrosclerotiorum]KAJ5690201.1 hypothetical protein N7462_004593 [Penicillium macrosclerotiorum]